MGEAASMNSALCLHLMAKDVRRARLWLGLTMGVAALALAHPFLPRPAEGNIAFDLQALQWITGALLVLAAVRLVHDDAGESAFLATRPAPLPERLLATALVMGLALISLGLIQCAHLGLMRLHLTPMDYALLFAETELIFGLVVFASLVLALLTPSLGKFIVVLVAIGVFWGAGAWIYEILKPAYDQTHQAWLSEEQLRVSRMVVLQAAVLGTSIAALWRHAARPGRRGLITLAAAGALVCLVLRMWWPLNFVAWLDDHQHVAPRAEWPDPSKLTFRFSKPRGLGNKMPLYEGGDYDGITFQTVSDFYRLDGLPALWAPANNGWKAVIHLNNGRELKSTGDPALQTPGLAAERLLGVGTHTDPGGQFVTRDDPDGPSWKATVAVYKDLDAGNARQNAKLDGTLRIPLTRPIVLGDMPLREGASVTWRRQRITIETVIWSDEQVQVAMTGESARLTLRGGQAWEQFRLFIVNPGKHECLDFQNGSSGSNPGYANYWVSAQTMTVSRFPGLKGTKPNIPGDWKNDARMYVVGVESGGELVAPYQYSSLDLGNDQPDRK